MLNCRSQGDVVCRTTFSTEMVALRAAALLTQAAAETGVWEFFLSSLPADHLLLFVLSHNPLKAYGKLIPLNAMVSVYVIKTDSSFNWPSSGVKQPAQGLHRSHE